MMASHWNVSPQGRKRRSRTVLFRETLSGRPETAAFCHRPPPGARAAIESIRRLV